MCVERCTDGFHVDGVHGDGVLLWTQGNRPYSTGVGGRRRPVGRSRDGVCVGPVGVGVDVRNRTRVEKNSKERGGPGSESCAQERRDVTSDTTFIHTTFIYRQKV